MSEILSGMDKLYQAWTATKNKNVRNHLRQYPNHRILDENFLVVTIILWRYIKCEYFFETH